MIRELNFKETLPIRQLVLWPTKPLEELYVSGDEYATHYGYFQQNELIGVISVFIKNNETQFRKFAVLQTHQNKGIGSALLNHVFNNRTTSVVWCNARKDASSFYKRFGMEVEADSSFNRGIIEYVKMKKRF